MSERQQVLREFHRLSDFIESRIRDGIEANRKGYAHINFQNPDGTPVPNVHVKASQKTHDFRFGANCFMLDEFQKPEQNEAYKAFFKEAFNIATIPFYWSDLEPVQGKPRYAKDSPKIYRRPPTDLCLEFCEQNGIEPKCHCLNYLAFSPEWFRCCDIQNQKRLLEKRFRELSERYADRIPSWEVLNEFFWGHHKFQGTIYHQPDFVDWSFETADRYFHNNHLIINEGSNNIWAEDFHDYRSAYYMLIRSAIDHGAHLDSIGMQFHMFMRREKEPGNIAHYYNPRRLYDVMDTYASLGRRLQVTEMTLSAYGYTPEDEEIQAEIAHNVYRIFFSHPAMEAIIYWNVIDGFAHNAVPGDMVAGENYYHGGLIRYDFTPKPAFEVIKNLIHKEYHTEAEAQGDDEGFACFKGFYGDYDLEVTTPDRTCHIPFHLGNTFTEPVPVIIPKE